MQTLRSLVRLFTPRTSTPRSPRSNENVFSRSTYKKLETGEFTMVNNIDTVDKFVKGEKYTIQSKGYGLACGSSWLAKYEGLTDHGECKFRLVKHPRIGKLGKNEHGNVIEEDFLVHFPPNKLQHVYKSGASGNTCKEDGKYFWSADGPVPTHLLSPTVKGNKNGNTRKMRKSRKMTRKIRKD